uniref:Uncharacterized protein n=1 Tax=Rhizophora mucronata TaxID=61149 RepID=A0A2P2J2I1_RHIMU
MQAGMGQSVLMALAAMCDRQAAYPS